MRFRETVLEKTAERAVLEFDANPVAKGFLRRLADESPEHFLQIALKHLQSEESTGAHRFLASIAVRHEEVANLLASPAFMSRESSQRLFRRFLAADPSFDVTMARKLPNRYLSNQAEALAGAQATRALDLLDHNSHGRRLLPILGHLPDSSDSRLAAKGALFVGRRVQNPAWSSQMFSRPDPRIRANAVESLWGINSTPAIRVLEAALRDAHNRVKGNALVGLRLAGHDALDGEVSTMAFSPSPPHRATAAWVMARFEEERWLEELGDMIRDESPQVRSRALISMRELRRLFAPAELAEPTPETAPAPETLSPEPVSPIAVTENAPDWSPEPQIVVPFAGLRLDGKTYRAR